MPLNEYLNLTREDKDEDEEKHQDDQNDSIIQFLAQRNQEKARKILIAMKNNGRFQWTATGDVMFDGKRIPNAHMADLLSFALRTLPIKNTKIAGVHEFVEIVKQMNIPRSLFTTSFLKYLDNDVKHNKLRGIEFKKFRDSYLLN